MTFITLRFARNRAYSSLVVGSKNLLRISKDVNLCTLISHLNCLSNFLLQSLFHYFIQFIHNSGDLLKEIFPKWLVNPAGVSKFDGKWRVCIYFTFLNWVTLKKVYPLPRTHKLRYQKNERWYSIIEDKHELGMKKLISYIVCKSIMFGLELWNLCLFSEKSIIE